MKHGFGKVAAACRKGALLMMALLLAQGVAVSQNRPKVAVVLSGGGAKGVAHIGALKVIEEMGIPVDIVCGTSMGSLVGGLYSIGYSTATLDSIVRSQDWVPLLSDQVDPTTLNLDELRRENAYTFEHGLSVGPWHTTGGGVIPGHNLMRLFEYLCDGYLDSMDFNDFPIPYACVATNIVDNSEVDFHSGHLTKAMRASMAIPGVFTPVRMGNRVLVDGGLRNNFPVDIAREMGADYVIGVSVQGHEATADDLEGAASVLGQIIDVNCKNKYERNLAMCDVVIRVDVEGYSAASFTSDAVDTLLRRGEEAAREHYGELKKIRAKFGNDFKATYPSRRVDTDRPFAPAERNRELLGRLGFRFDSEELGAFLIGLAVPLPTHDPADVHLAFRLGSRLMGRIELNSLFNVSYTFIRNDLDIYEYGSRAYNVRYRQHQVNVCPINFNLRNNIIKLGVRWDYFDYYGRILSHLNLSGFDKIISRINPQDENCFSYYFELLHNTENRMEFPTKGQQLRLFTAYRTPDMFVFSHEKGFTEAVLYWRLNVPLRSRLTLQPSLFGRLMIGDNIPFAFMNAVGGEWQSHYVEQQLPFAGIGHVEFLEQMVMGGSLQVQHRFGKNHYVLFRMAAGVNASSLEGMLTKPNLYGLQVGYSYNTVVGPIDVRLGWSNRQKGVGLYVNFGHEF